MFVKGGKLYLRVQLPRHPARTRLACDAPALGNHVVGVEFARNSSGENLEAHGQMTLYVDGNAVDSGQFRTQTGHYALCGEGLCVGYDSGDALSGEYKPNFEFGGGRVVKVVFDVGADVYTNVERRMAAAIARD